jgi:uncharacterized protein
MTTYEALKSHLKALDGVLVAFSGGVDSAVLLAAAHDALGDRVLAVIADSPTYPQAELRAAQALASRLGVRCVVAVTDELNDPAFCANSDRRCYFCKTHLFGDLTAIARREGLPFVVEGSNADDLSDYRPGLEAVRELGVRSPFIELGIGKVDIRRMAQERGLPVWDKPAAACLSSRIPYGQEITRPKLRRIERAEDALRALGFRLLRVRDHGELARIEISPDDFARLLDPDVRAAIVAALKEAGYLYVSMDLQGYRRGAMNEGLGKRR